MIGVYGHPAYGQSGIDDAVVQFQNRIGDQLCGGRPAVQIDRAVGVLWDLPSIAVGGDFASVAASDFWICQVVPVVADGEGHLIGNQPFFNQFQREQIRHLPDDQPSFVKIIGALEHLPGTDAVVFRPVGFDQIDGGGFPAPGMVDEQLGIDAEQLIQKIFVMIILLFAKGAAGDIAHGIKSDGLQLFLITASDSPEIRKRPVIPQKSPVCHLIQLCNAHAVSVRLHMLCHDVHGHFAQIQIGADSGRSSDPGRIQDVLHDFCGQFPGGHPVRIQIVGHIQEHFVDGIHMDIFGRDVFQVGIVDSGAVLNIESHPGRSGNVGKLQLRMFCKRRGMIRRAGKLPVRGLSSSPGVHFFYFLYDFKKPCPAGDAVSLQGGGHGKTDGLLCPFGVCHHQMSGKRV